jgi:peptide deformylase
MDPVKLWHVDDGAHDVPVHLIGAATLHTAAAAVDVASATWLRARDELVCTLAAFRTAHGFGRAIAAPQIGHSLRMIAINLGTGASVLLNPCLTPIMEAGTMTMWDDCFSFPDMMVRVRRWRQVRLDAMECDGTRIALVVTHAALAELLQHEVDHLLGVTSFQRVAWDWCDSDGPHLPLDGTAPSSTSSPPLVHTAVVHRTEYASRRAHFDALVGYTIAPTITPPTSGAAATLRGEGAGCTLRPFAEVATALGMATALP